MIWDYKVVLAILVIFIMPFIVGYVSTLGRGTDYRFVVAMYVIFIVMFTAGTIVKYKFGG